jgi:hypothetical protein
MLNIVKVARNWVCGLALFILYVYLFIQEAVIVEVIQEIGLLSSPSEAMTLEGI